MWPQYPAALLSFARHLAFGLIALPFAPADRRRLAQLGCADWREAPNLSIVGNLLHCPCLAGTLPTMIIGILPNEHPQRSLH